MQSGKQSVSFLHPVYITHTSSVVGSKEGDGPLGKNFDYVTKDNMMQQSSWEEAEGALQKRAVELLLGKACTDIYSVDLLLAGDLLGQSIASSFGTASFPIPHIGLYGACSTCALTLINGAAWIAGGLAHKTICVTSSHFASAEKEFRFPLAYGNQRPETSTWTVTGSGAFLLSDSSLSHDSSGSNISSTPLARVTSATLGKIVDYGVKDSMNMGACMAPAAASTIAAHLRDFHVTPNEYDQIITGDLGLIGQTLLYDLLWKEKIDIQIRHMDCGVKIYDNPKQGTHAGGSGCGCSAVTLAAYILPKLAKGEWKKVLFVPTGALLSKTSFNEGMSIPGIAHAVVLECPE